MGSTLDRTFRGYFAGQVVLALILSAGQLVVFTVLEIPYGVLFAVLIGFTTLIPDVRRSFDRRESLSAGAR